MCDCELPFVFVRFHEDSWDGLQQTPATLSALESRYRTWKDVFFAYANFPAKLT